MFCLNPETYNRFKKKLEKEKQLILDQISRLEETGVGDTMSDSVGELSVYDNHPADLGDELFERSKDTALRDNAHLILEHIEKALQKFKNDSYGICEKCGSQIGQERLETIPWVSYCINCQRKMETKDPTPRPVEEELLEPPFHRTFLDSAEFDYVGFDGEDALQSVLRYGSSDTPQDIPGSYDYKAIFPNSNEHIGIVERSDAIPSQLQDHKPLKQKKNDKTVKTEPQ